MDEEDTITIMIPKVNALDLGEYWGTKVTRLTLMELAVAQIPEGKVAVVKREEKE